MALSVAALCRDGAAAGASWPRSCHGPYTFAQPREAIDGMAGFSPADIMYLIMTDRFAGGDLGNDGPLAHSCADMPQLYYGDEVAKTGGEGPDNRRDMPDGFQISPGTTDDAFTAAGRTPEQQAMFS